VPEASFSDDIVKNCALSDRRQLADVPRVSRTGPHRGGRTAAQRAGDADQRGLHLRQHAPQAAQRAQAGVHRRVVRVCRAAPFATISSTTTKPTARRMPGELAQQIPMVHAACEALGVPILTSEALRGRRCHRDVARRPAAGFEVRRSSRWTRSFYQLVGDGIRVYNPRDEGTWSYDAEGVKDNSASPDHVVDVLALMGDTIDTSKACREWARKARAS